MQFASVDELILFIFFLKTFFLNTKTVLPKDCENKSLALIFTKSVCLRSIQTIPKTAMKPIEQKSGSIPCELMANVYYIQGIY